MAKAIADRLARQSAADGKSAQISYLQGLVAARLTLTTMLSVPLTYWWGSRKYHVRPNWNASKHSLAALLADDDADFHKVPVIEGDGEGTLIELLDKIGF